MWLQALRDQKTVLSTGNRRTKRGGLEISEAIEWRNDENNEQQEWQRNYGRTRKNWQEEACGERQTQSRSEQMKKRHQIECGEIMAKETQSKKGRKGDQRNQYWQEDAMQNAVKRKEQRNCGNKTTRTQQNTTNNNAVFKEQKTTVHKPPTTSNTKRIITEQEKNQNSARTAWKTMWLAT